jgi:hypothetical protein
MTADNPIGYTEYEYRELLGAEHAWAEEDNSLVFETPIEGQEDWIVTIKYYVEQRGIRPQTLFISPARVYPTPPPLSSSVIRKISVKRLDRQAKDWLAIRQQVGLAIETDEAEFQQNRRPGKVGRPDSFYARAALRYLELVKAGASPTKALAEERHISQSSARDLIHEARSRGLLTSMGRGQAGGQLTDKAKLLLAGDEGGED